MVGRCLGLLVLLVLATAIGGCGGAATPTSTPPATTGVAPSATSPAAPAAAATTAPPVATQSAGQTLTGEQIAAALKASNLPVSQVVAYTAETDPNHMLGLRGQYTAKVAWKDGRASGDEATMEVFADDAAVQRRVDYVGTASATSPILAEHVFTAPTRKAVLRLPAKLTAAQAAEYQTWLQALAR